MATRRMPDHIADHVVDLCMGDAQKIKPQITPRFAEVRAGCRSRFTIPTRRSPDDDRRRLRGDLPDDDRRDDYVRLTLTHIQHAFLDGAGRCACDHEYHTQTEDGQRLPGGYRRATIHHNPLDMPRTTTPTAAAAFVWMPNGTAVLACPTCGANVRC